MTYGLTPQGFNAPRLADVKQFLEDDFVAAIGDVNTDPQSVAGQFIGIFSKMFADQWENLEDVYFSQYPNSASGVSLDNVVQFNGITRLPETQTNVTATCNGLEGAYIPANSLANIPTSNQTFYALTGGSITSSNADIVKIQVESLTTQSYNILLDNTFFTYSLPVITFTGSFVSGNIALITLNGSQLTQVPYNTSSNQTIADIATEISTAPSVSTAIAVGNVITITPNSGYNVIVNSINNVGSGGFPTNAITFLAPGSDNILTAGLTAIINANTPPWLCVDNMDGTITINANIVSVPFSCSSGANLSIIYRASPITFLSQNYGPIPCPVGTLTNIVTPISGWQSITNLQAGSTGTFVETDAQLRIRRQNSIKLLGSATVEAITAGLLQKVPGVTSTTVFENTSLQQTNIVISFPLVFSASDIVTVTYNTTSNFMVNCPGSPNQVTSMGLLVTAFETLPEVLSASYGGTGNQVLTVIMNISTVLTVNLVTTSVSAQTAIINGGRPPKSFEAVVEGGTDEAVANQIWITKPAGIETFGNVNGGNGIEITDSQGNTQVIFFSRPSEITIWVQVALTLYTEETFPNNGVQDVALAIFNYGINLGVGIDVLLQRLLAQIFTVPGIASGDMTIGITQNSLSSSDITIDDNQISTWDLSRISVTVT